MVAFLQKPERLTDNLAGCLVQTAVDLVVYESFEIRVVFADSNHVEHESMIKWDGGGFDPEGFDTAGVKFDDPRKCWEMAFTRRR